MKKKKNQNPLSRKFIIVFTVSVWSVILIFSLAIYMFFSGIANGKYGFMPDFEHLENPNVHLATRIYSSDQVLLGTYFRENRSRVEFDNISPHLINALISTEDIRYYSHSGIDFKALPRVVSGFFDGGSKGGGSTITQQLAKMLFPREQNMTTMDLVTRKFKEWIIAVKLERSYTKEEIMEMYLNKFDFLNLAVGIESAARVYFDTTPDALNIVQSAMLVGMAQNPSLYNPLRRPEETLHRRNVVLSQMLKYGFLHQEAFDTLKTEPLGVKFQKVDHNIGSATYFREFLRQWLTAPKPDIDNYMDIRNYVEDSINWHKDPSYGWCTKNIKADGSQYDIYSDGLKIYTTINSKMQVYAEEAVAEHMGGFLQDQFFKDHRNRDKAPFSYNLTNAEIENIIIHTMKRSERWREMRTAGVPEDSIVESFYTPVPMSVFSWNGDIDTVMTPMDSIRYYKWFLRASFMSMEPHTGYVRAYVGGINYQHFKFDHVTRARRQVGSTIKPFIYTLAMQNGYSPCHRVPNIEVTFKLPEGSPNEYYTPKYSPNKKEGEMVSLKYGLAASLNQLSAWVLKQFSPQAVINIAQQMGVNSHMDPYPSICVGAPEVLLSEMVSSYGTFANKGIYTRPQYITRIEDQYGNVLAEFHPIQNEAISEETAYLMVDIMKGVVDFGTSVRLRFRYDLRNEIAGKTGTTNNHSDGWFIGYTPDLVSGSWVGGEERSIHFRGITYGQGASMALPIWGLFMQKVYADKSLPYSTEARFEKPVNLSVEVDCTKYNQTDGEVNYDKM
jgi:penicillin-binding protein 1A